MRGGDPATLTVRGGDPFEVAGALVEAGARWLHVVDLDAAVRGDAANMDTLERIATLPVRVQAGGGLSPRNVVSALDRGAARAVLGAGALGDRRAAARVIAEHPGRVGVGLDVLGDQLAPRGGRTPGEPLEPVLEWLAGLACEPPVAVITDVSRDGSLEGLDVDAFLAIADRTGLPAIASGGVRSTDDLRALAVHAPRVAGAIVGRALTEGAFTLAEAIAAGGG